MIAFMGTAFGYMGAGVTYISRALKIADAAAVTSRTVSKFFKKEDITRQETLETAASSVTLIAGGAGMCSSLLSNPELASGFYLLTNISAGSKEAIKYVCENPAPHKAKDYLVLSGKIAGFATPCLSEGLSVVKLDAAKQVLDVALIVAHSLRAGARLGVDLEKINEPGRKWAMGITVADLCLPILSKVGLSQESLKSIGIDLGLNLSKDTLESLEKLKNMCLSGGIESIHTMVLLLPEFHGFASRQVGFALTWIQNRRRPEAPIAARPLNDEEILVALREGRALRLEDFPPEVPQQRRQRIEINHMLFAYLGRDKRQINQIIEALTLEKIEELCELIDREIPSEFENQDVFSDFKCPISLRSIRHPVKLKGGSSVYEERALRNFLEMHPDAPVPGDALRFRRVQDILVETALEGVITKKCDEIKRVLRENLGALVA